MHTAVGWRPGERYTVTPSLRFKMEGPQCDSYLVSLNLQLSQSRVLAKATNVFPLPVKLSECDIQASLFFILRGETSLYETPYGQSVVIFSK